MNAEDKGQQEPLQKVKDPKAAKAIAEIREILGKKQGK